MKASVTDRAANTSSLPKYVLITPARNEAELIEATIRSVASQTLKPMKWVIVSDGSTDGTDDIVRKYAAEHPWIELVRRPERAERHFAGKVIAFNAGFDRVKGLDYDVVGNLDADITFEPDYFAFLMEKFSGNPGLGVGGTPFREGTEQYNYNFTNIAHVSGACQLFRRRCFEEIGGYVPIKGGGIDLVAVTTARMRGWQTQTFQEKVCMHHRTMGTASHSKIKAFLRGGSRDYVLGVHPLWEFVRSFYQMTKKPFIIGGCSLLWGFLWAMLTRVEKPVSEELVAFRRKEQMDRLKQFVRNMFTAKSRPASAASSH
jgi:biofilm PGA synthesis N-glycosyltransferase PgaC